MHKTAGEIAQLVNGQVVGDSKVIIRGLSGIDEAAVGDLAFLANPKYFPSIRHTKATAVLVPLDFHAEQAPVLIRCANPSLSFSKIAQSEFGIEHRVIRSIHPSAVVAKDVKLGKNLSIGACVVIESGAQIGDDTVIMPGCYVGHDVVIGKDTWIYPNVSIRERCLIGSGVVIHSGVVIGADGFGFVTVEDNHLKIPQIGIVVVEDNVEIGANTCIDRARFARTIIGRGTKIDNLVQIAHNVHIGENGIIVAQVGISGSTRLGRNVTIAGQVGVAGHLTIGDRVMVGAQSGVNKSVPSDTMEWGTPSKPFAEAKRVNAAVQRLPEYVKIINELKQRVADLEQQIKNLK